MKHTQTKRYAVLIPGKRPIVIRETTTRTHAVKHACYASELRIGVTVYDNKTKVTILSVPAIDRKHAVKPQNKRDKRYAKLARKAI